MGGFRGLDSGKPTFRTSNWHIEGPGRPRKWGPKVRLRELFAPLEDCPQAAVWLYGRDVTVAAQCLELDWDSPDAPIWFVLTQWPGGKPLMLLASDVTLSGPEVIEADGWRFKTRPKHGYPSEQWVRLALQHQWQTNLGESRQALLLPKLLAAKPPNPQTRRQQPCFSSEHTQTYDCPDVVILRI